MDRSLQEWNLQRDRHWSGENEAGKRGNEGQLENQKAFILCLWLVDVAREIEAQCNLSQMCKKAATGDELYLP